MTALQTLSPDLVAALRDQVRECPVPPPVAEREPVEVLVDGGRVLVVELAEVSP